MIWPITFHGYFLQLPIVMSADNEKPDQTGRMHRLIWVFIVGTWPKCTSSDDAAQLQFKSANTPCPGFDVTVSSGRRDEM